MSLGQAIATLMLFSTSWVGRLESHVAPSTQMFPTMSSAVDAIATQYGIRVGLELVMNDPDRLAVSLDLAGPAVASALDSVVLQKPEYAWRIGDGVYNIYPKLQTDSVLKVHIRKFAVTNATGQEISVAISALPEVKQWMLLHGVQRRELETGSRWKESDPHVTLSVKNVSLRTILNRVLKERRASEWIVVRYGDKQQYIAIYI